MKQSMALVAQISLRTKLLSDSFLRKTNVAQKAYLSSSRLLQNNIHAGIFGKGGLGFPFNTKELPGIVHSSKRSFVSFSSTSHATLKRLEQDANRNLDDPYRQLIFLRELNKKYPKQVIQRFEQNGFAVSEEVVKEYISALARVGRLDSVSLSEILKIVSKEAKDASANFANASLHGSSPASPTYFANAESSWKKFLINVLGTAAGFLLVMLLFRLVLLDALPRAIKVPGVDGVSMADGSDKRFTDVKGVDEAKAELEEIVKYLKNPEIFTRLGGQLPKGVLLMGPPGTGKTLLARAIAGEAGVPFFYASGSEFEEMYVGVGARRVRDLFEAAKRLKSPCIIFIDEIDAIGSKRNAKDQQGMRLTLNQLLVEMDGYDQNSGIIVVGATNFPDILDSALVRPGRFDRHVTVPLPDIRGRKQILELYTASIPLGPDVDIDLLARATPGMSGAALFNLVNEAALKASLDDSSTIGMASFEHAKDKILMGSERKSAVISLENATITAYHEGGHALVALMTPGAYPLYKATIMPRGEALGMVSQLPDKDILNMTRKQLLARLDVCMGGRVAEELVFGVDEVTSGASSDIQHATMLAREMVTKYGMSSEVGMVFHDLGSDSTSSFTRQLIDNEVKKLCEASYQRAHALLMSNRKQLELLAKALLEYETLSGSEIKDIIGGKAIRESAAVVG